LPLELSWREVIKKYMIKEKSSKSVRNKIISSVVSLFLVLAIFFCLFVVIQVLSKGHVSIAGHSFFKVVTGSMEPSISVGELILTKRVDMDAIEIGDVVSFRSKSPQMIGRIITHRVVDITENEEGGILLVTKGDANLSMDGYYVSEQNMIGKVIWQSGESPISGIMTFLSNKFGFLACIAFPALLISTLILRDNVKSMQRDIKKISDELEKRGGKPAVSDSTDIDKQEYEQMRDKIRAELIEELKQSDNSEQPKQQ